jgi:hypothetical protein
MLEYNFSETFISWGTLPKASLVNDDVLKAIILDDYKNKKEDSPDFKITFNKHLGWLIDLVQEQFKLQKPKYNSLCSDLIFGNVELPGQTSFRRNHYLKTDPKNSPVMIATYFLNGSGKLLIENEDPPILDRVYTHIIKPRTWVVFNSYLEYMRSKNTENEPRCSINILLKHH